MLRVVETFSGIGSQAKALQKLGIEYKDGGAIFRRTAAEINEIVAICLKYNIDYKNGGTIFNRTPAVNSPTNEHNSTIFIIFTFNCRANS